MRPSKFKPEMCDQASKLCAQGFTDKELADFFKVSEKTIYNWCAQHPEFLQSLKTGKEVSDNRVERALFHRATGYSHEDTHVSNFQGDITLTPLIKHYPPDTTACIFWLKNRRPAEWKDKHEVVITDEREVAEAVISDYLEKNPGQTRSEAVEFARAFIPEVEKLASELVQ